MKAFTILFLASLLFALAASLRQAAKNKKFQCQSSCINTYNACSSRLDPRGDNPGLVEQSCAPFQTACMKRCNK